ncbi:MAG: DUF3127 domain-containing protein [Flavobacterium sp.]|jgi:hypothetical protein
MEVAGKIKVINAEQQVSATFRKRELVVTTDEQYPQHIMVEFTQDKCDLLNNYKAGEAVKVSINLRGREWINQQGEAKYFNSIQGWRIERLQDAGSAPSSAPNAAAPETPVFPTAPSFTEEDHDDLPF